MSPPLPDIVYLVGPGGEHMDELRHSLRSVAANVPHGRVWIVGHKPAWVVNVGHVKTEPPSAGPQRRYRGAYANWVAALNHSGIADDFLLFNDDFFAMQPEPPTGPTHLGALADMAETRRREGSEYVAGLTTAAAWLKAHGCALPLAYETHQPLPVRRPDALAILGQLDGSARDWGWNQRSVYANFADIGGRWAEDVKARGATAQVPHGPWLSTGPASWRGTAGRSVRATFDKPCGYERAARG